MVDSDKLNNALSSLQAMIIKARKMSYDKDNHNTIARLLDDAEHVLNFIIAEEDTTEELKNFLGRVAKTHNFQIIIDRFEGK